MASFTIYNPRSKAFQTLETPSETDLTFEQVLLINILLELRVLSEQAESGTTGDDAEDIRSSLVQELS